VKAITLRFSEVMHELVAGEAAAEDISMAQFCREAAIARVFFQAGKRGDVREPTG
jgi:predicted HicB family RNase H-like nuclease